MYTNYTVRDILHALDMITGGRCVTDLTAFSHHTNPWVVLKSSGIPGKCCLETPGLVWGDPAQPVRKAAVCMTLTESVIELAEATDVDAIISHHPACEAANTGGGPLSSYLELYGLAYFELHEAFHGLHPGIPWLHGHMPFFTDANYGGIIGNVVNVGNVLEEIRTLGQLLDRLNTLLDLGKDYRMLLAERRIRGSNRIEETSVAARGKILLGTRDTTVHQVIHIHPHCGFTPVHLRQLKENYPESDTVIASISHVHPDHVLARTAEALGMSFLCGNSHAMEIMENGIPLAYALRRQLPGLEVVIFRERQVSIPLERTGAAAIQDYGRWIAGKYLTKEEER